MKHLFLSIILVGLVVFSSAQEFNGGIYGSALISQIYGDNYGGYNKFGFSGGFFVNRFVSEKLAPQLGLRYIQKGSRELTDNINYKCVLHYIELPITLRYFHYKKIDFEGGISLGYLMKGVEYGNDGYEITDAPPLNKFELAALAGVNYKLAGRLTIGIHFSYSILYIRPHSQNLNTEGKGQHNNVLMFTMAMPLTNWK